MRRRSLLAFAAVAAAAPGALLPRRGRAEDFWDRTLPDQPTDFIFGYGSLINTASRNATAGAAVPAIPVRVAAGFGYLRAWNDRAGSGFTALGLRRPAAGEAAMTINGVLYPIAGTEMADYDKREAGYRRLPVPRAQMQALSWQGLPAQGRLWVYVPAADGQPPGVGLKPPDAQYPLLQSYLDVLIEGGLEYGADFAREIIATTQDWSRYWLNDRVLGRRPWVYDTKYDAVDRLLSAAPHFADRLFPEQYAVQHPR